MRSNRRKDTAPELRLRKELFSRGYRYRVDYPIKIDGRRISADIVFPARKVAIFVDGCFWHRCPLHGRMPSDPTGYWHAKLARNVARDQEYAELLERAGWRSLRIWEHDTVAEALERVEIVLRWGD